MKKFLIVLFIGCIMFSAIGAEESPKEGIDRMEAAWEKGRWAFSWDYWLLSGSIAEKHGLALIPLVMERSKEWNGEEGLIYLPMLALLPRDKTVKVLKKYQEGGNEHFALWSGEFLTEFEMSDTIHCVEKYQKEKTK